MNLTFSDIKINQKFKFDGIQYIKTGDDVAELVEYNGTETFFNKSQLIED